MKLANETYLGDGLYASYDGFMITLRAPRTNGDHWVGLEPEVWLAFKEPPPFEVGAMNAYRLHAWLHTHEFNFTFLAEDDNEARSMVSVFYKVCQPLSHGPLFRVGREETRRGIKAVYFCEEGKEEFVPLEIVNLNRKEKKK